MPVRRKAVRRKAVVKSNPEGGFSEILKWGLIAGAAYYIYANFIATTPAAAAAPATGQAACLSPNAWINNTCMTPAQQQAPPTPPNAGTANTTPPSGTTTTTSAVTKSPGGVNLPAPFQTSAGAVIADANYASGYSPTATQMLSSAAGGAGLDMDQWLFYYNQMSGQNVTYEQMTLPTSWTRSEVAPVAAFVSAMPSSSGLSGMRGFAFAPQYTRLAAPWQTLWG